MSAYEFHIEDRSSPPFSTERELWLWGRNHATGEYMSAYFVDSALVVEALQVPAEGVKLDGGRPLLRYTGALHSSILDITGAIAEWHHQQTGGSPAEAEVRLLREECARLRAEIARRDAAAERRLDSVIDKALDRPFVLEKKEPKRAET